MLNYSSTSCVSLEEEGRSIGGSVSARAGEAITDTMAAGDGGGGVVVIVGRQAVVVLVVVQVVAVTEAGGRGHPAVDEMVVLDLRAAVQLGLDALRVGVGGQLLAGSVRQQEEGVVLGVGHAELGSADLAHLLGGGVWAHLQRLGGAAAACFLQRHPQVVLNNTITGIRFYYSKAQFYAYVQHTE